MSSNSSNGFSSAFDALLEKNREQFDELFQQAGASPTSFETNRQTPPREPSAKTVSTSTRVTESTTSSLISSSNESAKTLNHRFGQDWQYKVVEQMQEGNELVVLGRLTIPSKRITKAQFGRANVSVHPGNDPLGGTDQTALQQAAESALDRCVALL